MFSVLRYYVLGIEFFLLTRVKFMTTLGFTVICPFWWTLIEPFFTTALVD